MKRSGNALADALFRNLTRSFAVFVFLLLGAIMVSLIWGSRESISEYGLAFLWTNNWDPVRNEYGALVPIVGTLLTSVIALIIAIPVSFGIAMYLTELAPIWLRRPLGIAIEMLAAIPSIIYGMWGLFVLAPLFQHYLQPHIIKITSFFPVLRDFVAGPGLGLDR